MTKKAIIYPNGDMHLDIKNVKKFCQLTETDLKKLGTAKLKVDGSEITVYPDSVDFEGAGLVRLLNAMLREIVRLRNEVGNINRSQKGIARNANRT